jgi:uncharacterized protein YjbI with pentapeptide repeats
MTIKINSIISNLEDNSPLVIGQQNFSNEILFDQDLSSDILGRINFLNCEFEEVDFTGSYFRTCSFENFIFKNTIFSKCDFWNCTFQNRQILECNLTKSDFNTSIFTNCKFQEVNFITSALPIGTFFDKKNFEFISVINLNRFLDWFC